MKKGTPDPKATKAVQGMLKKLGRSTTTPVKIGPYQKGKK